MLSKLSPVKVKLLKSLNDKILYKNSLNVDSAENALKSSGKMTILKLENLESEFFSFKISFNDLK